MALGPGKYDDLCTHVREQSKAQGAMVIIFGGERGDGFSCQADFATTMSMADILDSIAKQIRADTTGGHA